MKGFWTFQQFIEFVEMTPKPALLAQILINYTGNNLLEHHEKLQLYTSLYFSAILSCRLEYLNKAFILLREAIIQALELQNFRSLEFIFTTILDFDFLNEVFEKMPTIFKEVIRKMIEDLYHCLENFHLPLIKAFKDQGLLLRFLRNKKINRKLGNFFYKKAIQAFLSLAEEKIKKGTLEEKYYIENLEKNEVFIEVLDQKKIIEDLECVFDIKEEKTDINILKVNESNNCVRKEMKISNKSSFKEIYESLKGIEINIKDKERLLIIWESLIHAKEFYLKEEVYEKAHECLKGVRMIHELMEDLCC